MDRLMFSDETLEALDDFRLSEIARLTRLLVKPTQRAFAAPFTKGNEPYNEYPTGARFHVGMDVFKVVSFRTRGKRTTMVVRFDGQLYS